jgi:ribosomal protein S25
VRDILIPGERRDIRTRATVVQEAIKGVIQEAAVTLTPEILRHRLGIPLAAAQRILERLEASGIVRQVQDGVWQRGASRGE